MILFLGKDSNIYAVNKYIPKEETKNYEDVVWFDGDFDFSYGEEREGFYKVFKWDGEKPVLEYAPIAEAPIPEPEPTMEEQILSGVNSTNESQLIIITEALATQYEEGLENDLNNKEVLATIYEELLAQKEVK